MIVKVDKIRKVKALYLLMLSVALTIVLIPLGSWSHGIKLQATLVSFFFFSGWQVGRNKMLPPGIVVVIILFPGCLFYGLVHALYWRDCLMSLPSSLALIPGTFLGVVIATEQRNVILKKCMAVSAVVLILSGSSDGFAKWVHKVNYGSFSGCVLETVPMVRIMGEHGDLIGQDDLAGKVVILDFWTTSCASCFVKFPRVEAMHQEFRARKDVFLIAVNVPVKEERAKAIQLIRDRGYTFNIGFMDAAVAKDVLGVNVFPTVIGMKDGTHIFYRGDIENISAVLDE